MKTVDLRSDTFTLPDDGMRKAIQAAEVGNSAFGEDPSVNRLEETIADYFDQMAEETEVVAVMLAFPDFTADLEDFFKHVWPKASSLLFLEGRLTFHYPNGSAPRHGANSGGPSVLISYGSEASRRLEMNKQMGAFVRLRFESVDILNLLSEY